MLIMFLPMPSGPSGPWVAGTKNLRERKIYAFTLVFLGLIAAGLLFWISLFVDKVGSLILHKDPSTLLGALLSQAGFNGPLSLVLMFGILISSAAVSIWVGASEKVAPRIGSVVFILLQILFISTAYIPA